MAEVMGALLARAEAFVMPGAFRGIEAGGVQADARVEKVSNFTNILRATFLYKSVLRSFYVVTVWNCNFWQKDI